MARNKEYDREEALNLALTLFWRQGYTATSVQQLLDTMKISRSTMYSDFGNKRDLFILILERYSSMTKILIDAIEKAERPKDAIQNFYEVSFTNQDNETSYRGCLLVNTILELRDVDDELSILASEGFTKMERALVECFEKCIVNGTLNANSKPDQLAAFFFTLIKGLRVVAREQRSAEYLRGVIETASQVI